MGRIAGSAIAEIDAPVADVFAIAADLERMPDWQTGLHAAVVLDRHRAGRPRRVRIETSHGAAVVRFAHRPPASITWEQGAGDAAHLAGGWRFTAAGRGLALAPYDVEVDFGRAWGLL